MASIKVREHRKTASGTYDVVHRETQASLVLTDSNNRFVTDKEKESIANAVSSVNGQTGEVTVSNLAHNIIPNNGNLNTITQTGVYSVPAGVSNIPATVNMTQPAMLTIRENGNFIVQEFVPYQGRIASTFFTPLKIEKWVRK